MTTTAHMLTLAICLFLSSTAKLSATDKIVIYTENFPPYNFLDETGAVVGAATELVQQVMARSGLAYEIKLGPWTRAMRRAESHPNSLIYSMARTESRSAHFDWLVPIISESYYLIGRKDDLREISTAAITKGVFTAICMQSDISCPLLRAAGFPEKSLIRFSSVKGVTSAATMMLSGRADFYPDTLFRFHSLPETAGLDISGIEAKTLLGHLDFYLAASKKLNPVIKTKIRESYQALLKDGNYQPLDPEVVHGQHPTQQ